jgi:hypothetical protein
LGFKTAEASFLRKHCPFGIIGARLISVLEINLRNYQHVKKIFIIKKYMSTDSRRPIAWLEKRPFFEDLKIRSVYNFFFRNLFSHSVPKISKSFQKKFIFLFIFLKRFVLRFILKISSLWDKQTVYGFVKLIFTISLLFILISSLSFGKIANWLLFGATVEFFLYFIFPRKALETLLKIKYKLQYNYISLHFVSGQFTPLRQRLCSTTKIIWLKYLLYNVVPEYLSTNKLGWQIFRLRKSKKKKKSVNTILRLKKSLPRRLSHT